MDPINISNYFPTLLRFRLDCEQDESLNPSTQLLFRLLVEQANCHRWQDTFTYPIDAIVKTSHLSRQTIIDARRRLKSKGYISFKGNPSRYTVNSLLDRQLDRRDPPAPLISIPQNNNTKEENEQRRKGATRNGTDPNYSVPPQSNRQEPDTDANERIRAQLKKLGY